MALPENLVSEQLIPALSWGSGILQFGSQIPLDHDSHGHFQSRAIGQCLQGNFPQSRSRAVAAATIGGNQDFCGLGKSLGSHPPPPLQNRSGGEFSGIVVDADAHPCFVVRHVEHAVGNSLPPILGL